MIKTNKKYFSILLFFILLCVSRVAAQPFSLKHLGIEDGLSNNYVLDIVQDGQGFIWIATESGLNRFDGKNFTVYRDNNSGLINNAVNDLLYDSEENMLWVGTKNGICLFNCTTGQFEDFNAPNEIRMSHTKCLSHATDGGIWINQDENIIHYDKKTKKCTLLFQGTTTNLYTYEDSNGRLFIGHHHGGLTVFDLKNNISKNYCHDPQNPKSLPGNSVYSVCIDHAGNIWVGTNQGLALLNMQTDDFLVFRHEPEQPNSLIADHIYNIQEMKDCKLWIASDIGGVSILDLNNISFMNVDSVRFVNMNADSGKNGLSSGNIRSLLQDSFGNIWIGNYSSGVDFINHKHPVFNLLPYTREGRNMFKNKPVWSVYADRADQVWLGGENEIIVFKNGELIKQYDITPYLTRPYGQVFDMHSNTSELMFLGIYDNGLLKLDLRNNRMERIPLDSDYIDVITFFEDSDNKIWIGTEENIYIYSEGVIGKADNINCQMPDKSIYGILRDQQGKLWIGTYDGGISIFDKTGKLTTVLSTDHGFCSNSISQLYMDSKGGIWAATRNGIAYIKDTDYPKQFELYDNKQSLNESHVRAIIEDHEGNIWISTNNEIAFWNRGKHKFDNYDHRDGVPTGNFIESSSCITSDGMVYFGSLNGVCYFNPTDITTEQIIMPIQIVECISLNQRFEESLIQLENGNINLSYRQNSFRITFSVPDFSLNQQVEYAYMLEGLDNEWYGTQGENHVTFHDISHGKYVFKVIARLKNQEWDESHITIMGIEIHPPLWLTWYAILFYVLVVFLIIFAWVRFYKRKLNLESLLELEKRNHHNEQELNKERLRFYTNITHELRTPLTLILGPLEDLLNDLNLSVHYRNKIQIIHDSAIRLLNLINQILEFRKTETQNRCLTVTKGDLGSLVTEIGLHFKELNRNEKVKFHISIEKEVTTLYFDSDVITTILTNLLSNAVKYTPEGEIRLTLSSVVENELPYTEIRVSDTGYGISSQDLPHIFDRYFQAKGKHQASGTGIGLGLVKSLADLHHGKLLVESKEGEGTTFRFRILTENSYPDALYKEAKKLSPIQETVKNEKNSDPQSIILVVEDNDDIREYIVASLVPIYKVVTAINGKEGIETAQKQIPDIIISDIMMPEMDGIELCRQIKGDQYTSHIPVVLLTAKDSIKDKEEGYESGADSYLTKPFSSKLLKSQINNLLESRRRLAQQILMQTGNIKPQKTISAPKISKLDEDFLQKTIAFIEKNISNYHLDIAFLTDQFNMSQSTLYRKIKGLTGISPNEFIRKIRLKHSARLLLNGNCNVSEAAYDSGFNDIAYFRECFKEEFGMTPSEYLKNVDE